MGNLRRLWINQSVIFELLVYPQVTQIPETLNPKL
jgi:hypothetical protein